MKYKIRYKTNSNLINTTDAESWISNNAESNESTDENCVRFFRRLCCVLSYVHFGFFITVICAFVLVFLNVEKFVLANTKPNFVELIGQPDIPVFSRNSLSTPPFWTLLDIDNFRVLQEPPGEFCKVKDLLFLLIVHSKPDHFRQRQAVRSTWGSLQRLNDSENSWAIRTVFILGEVSESENIQPLLLGQTVNEVIRHENLKYKDIVVGSFKDEYHNLRYKHILGLRWASNQCRNAIFFLKADDDAFIDLPGLQQYLSRTFGHLNKDLNDILAGNVFPSGTPPQRKGKWAVSTAEYPWSEYPSYLGGLAYLMTPEIAADLHKVAHTNKVPQVWVDDVWVTGLLAKSLHIEPILLNPQYSYDHNEMAKWAQMVSKKPHHIHSPPFTFAHLDPTQIDWKNTYQQLWSQVLLANNLTLVNNKILLPARSSDAAR